MDLKALTTKVIFLTHTVADFIKAERQKISSSNVEVKGLNNFVTYVDKTAEERLVASLSKLLPEAGFIAEENTSDKKGEVYNWVIDPLDGTTNFIHGVPCFCISIALIKNNKPILGVIHEINQDEVFYAWEGDKAYLNGKVIEVSKATALKDSLLVTGFPYYDYGKLDQYIELFKYFMRNTHGLRRLGSAAADIAYVACGRFESFYEYGLAPWDIAAGIIILERAGGKCTDFSGGDNFLFGKEIIASNTSVHDEMLKSVSLYFK